MSKKKDSSSGDDFGFKDSNKLIWKNPKPSQVKIIPPLPAPLPNPETQTLDP